MYNAENGAAMLRNGAKNTRDESTHPGHDTMHPSWSRRRTGPVQVNSRSTNPFSGYVPKKGTEYHIRKNPISDRSRTSCKFPSFTFAT